MPSLLERVQALVAAGRWEPSEHAGERRDGRGLNDADLIHGVPEASVLEEYHDHRRGPCVLLLQYDHMGMPTHVVWGFHPENGNALIITAYRPDLNRWEPDFRTRRRL